MAVSAAAKTSRDPAAAEPWFLDAVFYELSVKSFFDGNGDGLGDFRGLTEKLDYIQQLGADCIWLLPFFPSPFCDDGYDVADYRAVHPLFGSIDDVRTFLNVAHERGLRVAAEMVINHTSLDHPWFQSARAAPAGSALRDFYVWSDRPRPFTTGRASSGNPGEAHWSWDETAQAFYWHRFTRHQPDLNYENPVVREEMLKVLRFWADLGIDGLCLNGVSYLAEREGTRSEHLPESHAVLKQFRQQLLSEYPRLMLQAGVNAWPADAATYFGASDECQMAPHMPLSTRLFLAIKQEDRRPLTDILQQTPTPPSGCQWVTLLRNHDELTLALATDEERDYLFKEYASDPSMRLFGGIRRRLAPLAENNRQRIELLFSLLFALPGAPVIFYGDELGMGDNVFLGGRNAVRTPMQWSADRNGGFSTADFARLTLPPVMDPVYGHQAVNVSTQLRDSSSLLHWVRRLIALRKQHAVLSRGSVHLLEPDNQKVLALVRQFREPGQQQDGDRSTSDERVLVIANLSHVAQPVSLELPQFEGLTPVEMFGRTAFPRITRSPYHLTLAPHGFFWFQLYDEPPTVTRLAPVETEAVAKLPVIPIAEAGELFRGEALDSLERDVLPGFLRSQRWFGGKARQIEEAAVADWGKLPIEGCDAWLVLVKVRFVGGQQDTYSLPISLASGPAARQMLEQSPSLAIARVADAQVDQVLFDALADDRFCAWLLSNIGQQSRVNVQQGVVQFDATPAYAELRGPSEDRLPTIRGPATSSNSLVFFGRRLLLKFFRRLEQGVNPDYEVGEFLTNNQRFSRTPPVAGKLEYQANDSSGPMTLGILQALVPNQGDGWGHAIDELNRYFERASARMFAPDPVQPDPRPVHELARAAPPPAALETIAGYLLAAATLGRRTAEMHLALASDKSSPDFSPEPITADDAQRLKSEIGFQAEQALTALAQRADNLDAAIARDAKRLLGQGQTALDRLTHSWDRIPEAAKTRVHGDYHLGQVLWVDNDYVILDFEGEPTRSVEERRAKFSPLRDVAGMLRSYHYAAFAALFAFTRDRPADFPRLEPWAELWQQWTGAAFLAEYFRTASGAAFLPQTDEDLAFLLDAFTLSKALYELAYELNNRPDWVRIPLSGVLRLLNLNSRAGR